MHKKYRDQQGRALRFGHTRHGIRRARKCMLRLKMGIFCAQNYAQIEAIQRAPALTKEEKFQKAAAIAIVVIKDAQQKLEQLKLIRRV